MFVYIIILRNVGIYC